jgi:citrate lyase subunit beta/citryl-CoA lyase
VTAKEQSLLLRQACSFLFVPGDQPELISKALNLKTDAVIIDLEDAVRKENKESARKATAQTITQNRSDNGPLVVIRTNAFSSSEFLEDLNMAITLNVDAIMLPKFVPGIEAENVDKVITSVELEIGRDDLLPVIALIESTVGVLNLLSVSSFPRRVVRLAFGAADLYEDLGLTHSETGPNSIFAMASIVMASVNCCLGSPIDSPHFDIKDDLGLRASSLFAHEMGFGGKLCIHPEQLAIVMASFAHGPNEQLWAARVMEKWNQRNEGRGAILVDGSLVDEAIVKRARQILSLW